MTYRTPLLRRIEAHLQRTRLSATRFSRLSSGDPRLLADLRAGRTPGPALERRITAWMDAQEIEAGDAPCSR